jgi:hypothetical protein
MVSKATCKECGRVTLRLSWSQLRVHEECKQKGYLSRTRKRAALSDQRNFFPGNVTDRVVRDWLNGGDYTPGSLAPMVEMVMDREERNIREGKPDPDPKKHVEPGVLKWRDREDKSRIFKECTEAAEKIEPLLQKYVVPFDFQPDFRFDAPLSIPHPRGGRETVTLIGYMDILVRDNNENWWVFDVKHTRDSSYWRKTVGQLTFYDLAVFLMFGKPTAGTALFQPLATPITHPHRVTDQARAEISQRFVGLARDIWNEDHTPKADNAGCNFCDFKHACTKFKPVIDQNGRKRVAI